MEKLAEDWKKKDFEKEKLFKMCESKLGSLEKTMNQKALDLQKREQKLFFVEEELKTKVSEASKQISKKDDEIIQLKMKFKEEK